MATNVVAVANQKGGSGKTTLTVNLAVALGEKRKRVLVIDADPQADASNLLGVSAGPGDRTLYDVLTGECELPEAIAAERAPGVDLVIGTERMAEVELTLAGQMMRERYLTEALADHIDAYDLVLIDCPPNLGLLTVNALVAASDVLIVLSMIDRNALKGAMALIETVKTLNAKDVRVSVAGLLRNNADSRRVTYKALNEVLTSERGLPLLKTEVPLGAEFHNATTAGQPLLIRNPHSDGSEAVRKAAKELLGRLS